MTDAVSVRPPREFVVDDGAPRPPLFGLFVVDGRKSAIDTIDFARGADNAFDAGRIDFELWLPSGDTVYGAFEAERPVSHRRAYGLVLGAADLDPGRPDFWGESFEQNDPSYLDVSAWRGDSPDEYSDSWIRLDESASADSHRRFLVSSAERPSFLQISSERGTTFLSSPGSMARVAPTEWVRVHLMPFRTQHGAGHAYGVFPLVEEWLDVCVFHAYLANRSRRVARILGSRIRDRVLAKKGGSVAEAIAAVHCQLEFGGLKPNEVEALRERLEVAASHVRRDHVPDISILALCLDVQARKTEFDSERARAVAEALRFGPHPTPHFSATARIAAKLAMHLVADFSPQDPVARDWRELVERFRHLLADTATFQYEASRPGVPNKSEISGGKSAVGAKKKSDRANLGRWPV